MGAAHCAESDEGACNSRDSPREGCAHGTPVRRCYLPSQAPSRLQITPSWWSAVRVIVMLAARHTVLRKRAQTQPGSSRRPLQSLKDCSAVVVVVVVWD